jgi:hypothetical protein
MAYVAEFSLQDKYVHCVVTLIISVDQLEKKRQLESDQLDQSDQPFRHSENNQLCQPCVCRVSGHRSSLRQPSPVASVVVVLVVDQQRRLEVEGCDGTVGN